MAAIDKNYFVAATTPSDINEHLPTLYDYACQSEVVVEMGVRSCVSTWAFVRGLLNNKSSVKYLVGVDKHYHPNIDRVQDLCDKAKIDYVFMQGNSTKVKLPPCDILFVDTWHVYAHLIRELEAHCNGVKKWIIMHDTTVDAEKGETLRAGWNPEEQAAQTGYPVNEITMGLWPAIEKFLGDHPEWVFEKRYTNCNGLTILRRV